MARLRPFTAVVWERLPTRGGSRFGLRIERVDASRVDGIPWLTSRLLRTTACFLFKRLPRRRVRTVISLADEVSLLFTRVATAWSETREIHPTFVTVRSSCG